MVRQGQEVVWEVWLGGSRGSGGVVRSGARACGVGIWWHSGGGWLGSKP